jgi:hypothetical protein
VRSRGVLDDEFVAWCATEIDERGAIHMFAHLKIQAGGGALIPRIYFHDHTDGSTGAMHVGFIGPHRYVQNTKT